MAFTVELDDDELGIERERRNPRAPDEVEKHEVSGAEERTGDDEGQGHEPAGEEQLRRRLADAHPDHPRAA